LPSFSTLASRADFSAKLMNTGATASQCNALTPCRNYFGSSLHPAEVLSATSSRYRASFGAGAPSLLNPALYSWRSAGSALTTPGDISVEFSKSVQFASLRSQQIAQTSSHYAVRGSRKRNCPGGRFKPESKSPTTKLGLERVIVLRCITIVALHVNLALQLLLRWPSCLQVPQTQKITRGRER
jgi:hypothetical protein